jgi:hypothetical protein
VNDPAGQRLMGAPAGRTSPRDVPKRLDPFRPEHNRGHRHRSGRRGHHCSSTRFGRGIGFSRSTVATSANEVAKSVAIGTTFDPPPNPPLVRGGAWRSVTLCDGKCPPRHKFSTGKSGLFVLRIWFRKKWGFESPSPHCNQFGKLGPMDLVSSGRWASDPPPDPPLFPSVLVPMTMRTVAGDNGFGWLTQAARESRLVAQGADVLGAECALADTMPTWLAALISGGTGAEAGAEYSCVTFCRAHRCRYRVCRAAWARRPVRVL